MQTTDKTPQEPDYLMMLIIFLTIILTAATIATLIIEYFDKLI